jgi:hypothetical protein
MNPDATELTIALAAVAIIALWWYWRRPFRPLYQNTDEMMQHYAAEAVDLARAEHDIELDYSVESIERVEEILAKLHEDGRSRDPTAETKGLALAFGAYIGEAIKRSEPDADWEQDQPAAGERSFALHWRGDESFPINWCYKRLVEGPEDNVWHKYVALKGQRDGAVS